MESKRAIVGFLTSSPRSRCTRTTCARPACSGSHPERTPIHRTPRHSGRSYESDEVQGPRRKRHYHRLGTSAIHPLLLAPRITRLRHV